MDVFVRDHERESRFQRLFDTHRADVVAYCGWRADTRADAQDAVAEVFLVAWRRLDEIPDDDEARIWLYGTARRVLANQRRSRRRRTALHERLVLEQAVDTDAAALGDVHDLVHRALDRIGRGDREILLLSEWEGLSPREIADVVGCLTVTARGRLYRARRRFQAAYEELQARTGERDPRFARADVPHPQS